MFRKVFVSSVLSFLMLVLVQMIAFSAEPVIKFDPAPIFVEGVSVQFDLRSPITSGEFSTTLKVIIPDHVESANATVPGILVSPPIGTPTPGQCVAIRSERLLIEINCWFVGEQGFGLGYVVTEPNIPFFDFELQGQTYRVEKRDELPWRLSAPARFLSGLPISLSITSTENITVEVWMNSGYPDVPGLLTVTNRSENCGSLNEEEIYFEEVHCELGPSIVSTITLRSDAVFTKEIFVKWMGMSTYHTIIPPVNRYLPVVIK